MTRKYNKQQPASSEVNNPGQGHASSNGGDCAQQASQPFDSRALRDALGQFTTGVAVVTVLPGEGAPLGVTVNSFASVSLDPPLILWSLQKDSETVQAFECSDNFVVNVLASHAQTLSDRYAERDNHELDKDHFICSDSGLPLLKHAKVQFECSTLQRIDAGDHKIYLARVLAVSAIDASEPLVFYDGAYHRLDLPQ
ncbi:MAG: flavin reductase family protein [Pseudomonadales bacterium]|nr:flavin reductase family protein [Pseudomonadales bacterium]